MLSLNGFIYSPPLALLTAGFVQYRRPKPHQGNLHLSQPPLGCFGALPLGLCALPLRICALPLCIQFGLPFAGCMRYDGVALSRERGK
jgi:hypothetical protein